MIKLVHEQKLEQIIKQLNRTMEQIRKYEPEANLFFASDGLPVSVNLHLKENLGEKERRNWIDSIYWSAYIYHSDCGGY